MIINDDRLIIRKKNNSYSIYNTPMNYIDVPKEKNLDAIYLIKHARENTIKKIIAVKLKIIKSNI